MGKKNSFHSLPSLYFHERRSAAAMGMNERGVWGCLPVGLVNESLLTYSIHVFLHY